MSEPPVSPVPAADDDTAVETPADEVEIVEVTSRHVSGPSVPAPPYPSADVEEVAPAVVTEREEIRVENDGSQPMPRQILRVVPRMPTLGLAPRLARCCADPARGG